MAKRSNGEGSVTYNDERKRWEGRLTIGIDDRGQAIRRKVTARTKTDVLKRLRQLRDAADAGSTPARADLTIGRYLDQWLELLPGTVSPATEQQYRDVVRLYVKPHVGRKRLANLTPRDVTLMLKALEEDGRSPNTRRLARSVLRRALRRAEVEGLVLRNVAAIADGVRIGADEGRTLTPQQARTLLASVRDHRLGAAFTVALSLGLRRGELLGLAWDDVDLAASPPRVTIRRTLKRLPDRGLHLDEPKTPKSRRTLHLPGPVADELRAHRRRQIEERLALGDLWHDMPLGADLVFRTPAGTAVDPDNFRNACYRATELAGLGRWSPHELRHSAASLLLAMNVPLKTVSETLGHSSIRVTADVYSHLLEPARTEAADAMTEALFGS